MTIFDLRHEDCIAGLTAVPAESVDLIVTSPPYNLDIAYSAFEDNVPREAFLGWCLRWATELERVLKPAGSLFLNIGAAPANPLLPHQLVLKLGDLFVLQNTIHWIKSITVEPRTGPTITVGHFKPINSRRFLTDCHEYVFHLTKSGEVPLDRLAVGVPYSDKSNIARWNHTAGEDLRCRGNNWFVPYETIRSRDTQRPHPATFPVKLAEWCIRLHGASTETAMLDPFLGIGNAAIAAGHCKLGRFLGFEIDGAYLTEAQRRIATEFAQA